MISFFDDIDIGIFVDPKIDFFSAYFCNGFRIDSSPLGNADFYYSGVFHPKENWSLFDLKGVENLVNDKTILTNNLITVSKVNQAFLDLFYDMILNVSCPNDCSMDEYFNYKIVPRVKELFIFEIQNYCSFSKFPSVGLQWTSQCSFSSTFDQVQKRYRGLHIDSWGESFMKIDERGYAGLRASINLGTEARSVLFVPLSLMKMREKINHFEFFDFNIQNAAYIAEKFMTLYPEYPLLRFELPPGYFIIMPVQNIIHDGYLNNTSADDLNLMISSDCMSYRDSMRGREFHFSR